MTDWYKIKRVLIWQGWVEKQIYPAGWKPWANTVAYYPLNSTTNFTDQSWNGYDLTNSWGSITTFNWVSCAYYSGSTSVYSQNTSITFWTTRTINFWVYVASNRQNPIVWTWAYSYWAYSTIVLWLTPNGYASISNYQNYWLDGTKNLSWGWVNMVWVVNWSDWKVYTNWQLELSWWYTLNSWSQLKIWWRLGGSGSEYFQWYVNEIILENKERTAQEISDYYNQTKSNYGL